MTVDPTPPAIPTFDDLKLSEPIRRALADVGYITPTSVQTAVFEPIASGRDVIVQSKTGSGKTAAFALPLLDRVVQPEKRVQAMVLCPTRELAIQVASEIARLGKHKGIHTVAIYGGSSMSKQIDELKAGAQMVAGTPGRVLDHLRRGTLDVKGLKAICLDEADEMLSMGFAEELNAILEFIPKKRQGLLFSATMPEQIHRLARRHLTEPEVISLSTDNVAPSDITHYVYFVGTGNRGRELARILEIEKPDGAIVFCNTKDETELVAGELQRLGFDSDFLNGDLEQSSREKVMNALKSGRLKYLVATDVAARGIDISKLSHVINYGFPESAEQYVHRTGRTGRAGHRGTAISLITPKDVGNLYFLRLTYGIRPIERELPSGTEERTRRELDRIKLLREAFTGEPAEEAFAVARRLLTHDDAERTIAWLIGEFFNIATRQAIAQGLAPAAVTRVAQAPVVPPAPAPTIPNAPVGDVRSPTAAGPREPRVQRGDRRARDEVRPAGETRRAPISAAASAPAMDRPRRVDIHHAPDVAMDDEAPEAGMEEIRLAVGRRDGIRAGDVARLVRERGRLNRRDIGRIFVRDRFTLVSVRAELRDATIEALRDAQLADRPLAPEPGKSVNPTIAPPPTVPEASTPVVAIPAARVPKFDRDE